MGLDRGANWQMDVPGGRRVKEEHTGFKQGELASNSPLSLFRRNKEGKTGRFMGG